MKRISIIRQIVETGRTTARINDSFPGLAMTDPNNFKSLLYYFGLLTISGTERGEVVLTIPNQTVREQLYTYLVDTYRQSDLFADARAQLLKYAADPIVTETVGKAKLRLITVVFRTWEVVEMDEVALPLASN